MPTFSYQGQASEGHKAGLIDAGSASAAADALRLQGIIPFDISLSKSSAGASGPGVLGWLKAMGAIGAPTAGTAGDSGQAAKNTSPVAALAADGSRIPLPPLVPQTGAAKSGSSIKKLMGFKEIPSREDVMMLARQLHVLIKAGVPIIGGIAALQDATTSGALKTVLTTVIADLESGQELSRCLASHPKVFDDFFVSMVRVGEETGRLDEVFWALYERMEFDERIRRQMKSATRYPMFVLIAIVGALAVVNLMVIPAFAKVFDGMGVQLPLLTRVLLWTSRFAQEQLPFIVVFMIAMGFVFKAWVGTPSGRLKWDTLMLKMPLFGSILLKASLSRFCRGMSLALMSGVPVLQAISIVAKTTDNEALAQRLGGMRETIERGESVLGAAKESGVFPPMVIQMIAVGDQSGQLDDLFNEVATSYTKDVQYELQTFSQRLEPILIVVMGVLVLILALGIFLPIWDLGSVTMKKT